MHMRAGANTVDVVWQGLAMAFAEVLNLSSFILYTMYTYNCKGHVVNIYVARSRLLYLYIEKTLSKQN